MRGYTLRLPLDLFVVASANPGDYTSRGRIITPLKDRLGSQIRTYDPRMLEHEISILRPERMRFEDVPGGPHLEEPPYMLEVVAELSHLARRAPDVSQRVGVSVRISTANLETLLATAYRRAVRLGEPSASLRISDAAGTRHAGRTPPAAVGRWRSADRHVVGVRVRTALRSGRARHARPRDGPALDDGAGDGAGDGPDGPWCGRSRRRRRELVAGARAGRLPGLRRGGGHRGLDDAAGHESLDAAGLLPRGHEGRTRARYADPQALPARHAPRRRVRLCRARDPTGHPGHAPLAGSGVRHEPAARPAAGAAAVRPRSARQPRHHLDHRR